MSSPGSGKTSLLERTIADLGGEPADLRASRATRRPPSTPTGSPAPAPARSRSTPAPAATSTPTWSAARCARSTRQPGSLLFVENVGNLVCPALFDVGEHARVVVISVTEGDDKPLKYPTMFAAADLVVVNKIDLLPYVDFDLPRLHEQARSLNRDVAVLPLSVRTGERVRDWYAWLDALAARVGDTVEEGVRHGTAVGP